jgi:hypothetical protein
MGPSRTELLEGLQREVVRRAGWRLRLFHSRQVAKALAAVVQAWPKVPSVYTYDGLKENIAKDAEELYRTEWSPTLTLLLAQLIQIVVAALVAWWSEKTGRPTNPATGFTETMTP